MKINRVTAKFHKLKNKIKEISNKKLAIYVFLVAFLIYIPSLWSGFLYDDTAFATNNKYITEFQIKKILTTDFGEGANVILNRYRPITALTLAWDFFWWDGNPMVAHLTNNLLHGLAVASVFLALVSLGIDKIRSLLVSVIFAINPLNVEVVSFVSSRGDSLIVIFLMLGLMSLMDKKKNSGWKSVGYMFLALLSKEMAVVGIGVYALVWWMKGLDRKKLWVVFGSIVAFLVYYWLRSLFVVDTGVGFGAPILSSSPYENSLWVRVMTLPRILFEYFWLLLTPLDLYMDRSVRIYEGVNVWILFLGVVLYLLYVAGKKEYREKNTKWIWFSMLWFGITLSIVSGVVRMSNMLYEHWMYIPMIGFFLGIFRVFDLYKGVWKKVLLVLPIWMLFLGYKTIDQQKVWAMDSRGFYEYMYSKSKSPRMAVNLCKRYAVEGDYTAAHDKCLEAGEKWDGFYDAFYYLGLVQEEMGRWGEAEESYNHILEITPNALSAKRRLFDIYMKTERYEEAILMAKSMVEQNPNEKSHWIWLSQALEQTGDIEGAQAAMIKSEEVNQESVGFESLYE